MLAVLVQRHVPRDLLGLGVDLDVASQAANGLEHLPRHLGDGPIRGQRDSRLSPVAVLNECLVSSQVEPGDDRAQAIGRGQHPRLPAAGRQSKGGMLELGLRRSELDRQLAEDLSVGVECVAGLGPRFVRERGPPGGGALRHPGPPLGGGGRSRRISAR